MARNSPFVDYPVKRRTRRLEIRLTAEEYERILSMVGTYGTLSALVRTAINQLNNDMAVRRFALMDSLYSVYKKNEAAMSWSASNLNQAVRRIHELAMDNILDRAYLDTTFFPCVSSLLETLLEVKRELRIAVNQSTRI